MLAGVFMCAGLAAAQRPDGGAQRPDGGAQPAVTFRTEINFVEVHAIVTDARGAFVGDLTKDDFEIFEDGRPQAPAAVSLIELPTERPFTPVTMSAPVESDVRATTRTFDGRIYILLLDDLHTTPTRTLFVREAAGRFIQQYLGVNDLAAVVYTSGRQESGQELTGSRRFLLAAIDRFQGQKLPSAGVERLAVHLRATETAQVLADESQPTRSREGLENARNVRDPSGPQRALNAKRALQAIEDVSTWLSDVQGRRKALLFFSEGIDYDIYQPFDVADATADLVAEAREAAAAAQRANVNLYGIDPRGLSNFGELIDISGRSDYPQLEYGNFRGALRELRLSQESLIALSEETGGLAIVNAGDVIGGLGRIVLDNSRYYLLGYYSDTTRWSRRFLKIDVKVKRPGVNVRARRGFMPPNPKAASSARNPEVDADTSPALRAALAKPVPVGDLPVRVFAAPFRGTGSNGSVLLAIEIDGQSLTFLERTGRFVEKVEVSIVAADQRAKVQATDHQAFDMNLLPQNHDRVRTAGLRLLSRLEVPPARYQIHVGVHEAGRGAIGTVPYDIEVPDYARSTFALSGVLVSSTADARVTANQDPRLKETFRALPTSTRRFSRAETLTWFVEAYDNSSRTAHAIEFTSDVLDARSGQTVFRTQDRRAVDGSTRVQTHAFRNELPLKDVSPGVYVLRVVARSTSGGDVAERLVSFEVTTNP